MNATEEYLNGNITATQCYALLGEQIKILTEQKDLVYKDALNEAKNFNKGDAYYGYVWEIRSGATTYDFEADEEYRKLNEQLKERRAILTNAAKLAADNKTFFDNNSGEQIPKVPVKSVAKEALIFKKK